ncbi:hypothetical protein PVAND_010120 [Polypedilum vanderplanki]|uniref:Bromodomain-containing protein n=1 Tax=Polypedilum vanderplanki TaxID=319348 RepID=A0A9J6CES7_POLVA|nr:hypothetical protein PVAND_010120 [Polypedilum vanderplanki]
MVCPKIMILCFATISTLKEADIFKIPDIPLQTKKRKAQGNNDVPQNKKKSLFNSVSPEFQSLQKSMKNSVQVLQAHKKSMLQLSQEQEKPTLTSDQEESNQENLSNEEATIQKLDMNLETVPIEIENSHNVCILSPSNKSSKKKSKTNSPLSKCKALLKELRISSKHIAYASIFYEPVDPIANKCFDYLNVIKQPMDLSTIHDKMENGIYKSPEEFAADIRLMINNCVTYNPPNHPIISLCQQFQKVFEDRFNKIISPSIKEESVEQVKSERISRSNSFNGLKIDDLQINWEIGPSDADITFIKEQIKITEKYLKHLYQKLDKALELKKNKSKKRGKNRNGKTRSKQNVKDKKSNGPPLKKKKFKVEDEIDDEKYEPMDYEEKRQLSLKINKMQNQELYGMIDIVKESEPNFKFPLSAEEFELDFDTLKPKTMRKLEAYVNDIFQPKRLNMKRVPIVVRKGKLLTNKNLIPEIQKELETNKKELEKKLESVEGNLGMRKKIVKQPSPPPSPMEHSSSSSSSDSSSSDSDDSSSSDDEA